MCEPKKTCSRCGVEKPLSEYYKHPTGRYGRQGCCRPCHDEKSRLWRVENPDKFKKVKQNSYRRTLLTFLLRKAKARQKARGEPWDLKLQDLPVRTHCPACGQLFLSPVEKRRNQSRTLDRIDNTKGYQKGNVEWLCWRCNSLKGDGSAEEHRRIADYIDSRLNPQPPLTTPGFPFCF